MNRLDRKKVIISRIRDRIPDENIVLAIAEEMEYALAEIEQTEQREESLEAMQLYEKYSVPVYLDARQQAALDRLLHTGNACIAGISAQVGKYVRLWERKELLSWIISMKLGEWLSGEEGWADGRSGRT